MPLKNKSQIDWSKIDTVLLDMDGTLIDRYHEDYFWEILLPKAYAKKNKMKIKDAKIKLMQLYKKAEGTAEWSDIDWWEQKLGMDLWKLRPQIRKFMKMHPHTLRFLKFLKKSNKKIFIVSASDRKDVDFKMAYTQLKDYFDGLYCHDDIGNSKHDQLFWENLQKKIGFDKKRTLFADDKENILKAAKQFGIKYIIFKAKSSSRLPAFKTKEFQSVRHFDDVL